jgi:hypothetical protein
LLEEHHDIVKRIPAYHISSYLGITNPSLSRIRKRVESKKADGEVLIDVKTASRRKLPGNLLIIK